MIKYVLGRINDEKELRSKEDQISFYDLFPGIVIAEDKDVFWASDEDRNLHDALVKNNIYDALASDAAYSYFSGFDSDRINFELAHTFNDYGITIPDFLLEKGGHGLKRLVKVFSNEQNFGSEMNVIEALSLLHNKKYSGTIINVDGKWTEFYYPLDYSDDEIHQRMNAVKAMYYGTVSTYYLWSGYRKRVVGTFTSPETTLSGVKNDFIETIDPDLESDEVIVCDSVEQMRYKVTHKPQDRSKKHMQEVKSNIEKLSKKGGITRCSK